MENATLRMRRSTIGLKTEGPAGVALAQQVEIFGRDQVSLDSLWRASGCPQGLEPRTWIELARPLLQGFDSHLVNLLGDRGRKNEPSTQPLIWTWDDETKDPWWTGDLMTNGLLASVYAAFLSAHPRAVGQETTASIVL